MKRPLPPDLFRLVVDYEARRLLPDQEVPLFQRLIDGHHLFDVPDSMRVRAFHLIRTGLCKPPPGLSLVFDEDNGDAYPTRRTP